MNPKVKHSTDAKVLKEVGVFLLSRNFGFENKPSYTKTSLIISGSFDNKDIIIETMVEVIANNTPYIVANNIE